MELTCDPTNIGHAWMGVFGVIRRWEAWPISRGGAIAGEEGAETPCARPDDLQCVDLRDLAMGDRSASAARGHLSAGSRGGRGMPSPSHHSTTPADILHSPCV